MMDGVSAARCDSWLSTWTGNRLDRLMAWYTEDCVYADPMCPDGLFGKAALAAHLGPLLARFPDWEFWWRLSWQDVSVTGVFWRLRLPSLVGLDPDGSSHLLWRHGLILQQTSVFSLSGLALDSGTVGVVGRRSLRMRPCLGTVLLFAGGDGR
jgi:ketosteroid isomerase-like protein